MCVLNYSFKVDYRLVVKIYNILYLRALVSFAGKFEEYRRPRMIFPHCNRYCDSIGSVLIILQLIKYTSSLPNSCIHTSYVFIVHKKTPKIYYNEKPMYKSQLVP